MRITTTVAVLLLVVPAWAKKEINPADYPLSAHVRSVSTTRVPTVGRVRNDNGETARVHAMTTVRSTEVQVGSTIYTSDQICPALKAGMDVPARIADKKDFWNGSRTELDLLVNGKVCTLRVSGTEEAK